MIDQAFRRASSAPSAVHRHTQLQGEIVEARGQTATATGDGMAFEGHAAVFNLPTYIGPPKKGFYEQIAPGAFARVLKAGADVRCVQNHDPNLLLGRTTSGTLQLSEDDRGLHQKTEFPDTTYARDLSALIRRGDVTGQSFQFTVTSGGESWSTMPGGHSQLRTIKEISNLIDVGPVTYPAYADATIAASVRSTIFPSRELRDGVGDYGLAAMVAATDAALDCATVEAAAGHAVQAAALLTAAASTIDQAAYSLWSVDTDLLQSLGLPDITAMVTAVDSAIDAAIAGQAAGDPTLIAAACGAADAVMDALHIEDPDRDATPAEGDNTDSGAARSWISTERLLLESRGRLIGAA